jgi:hypothetical protein
MQQYNFKLQEVYLQVVTNKHTLHSTQIKEYYQVFTGSKAESLIFNHELSGPPLTKQSSESAQKELVSNLKRLHCRLIEKIMVKVVLAGYRYHTTSAIVRLCTSCTRSWQCWPRSASC